MLLPSTQMEPRTERPPLLARAEVVIANAIPFIGVAFLGWNAFTVILLYVLDGWLSVLGLGASVMIQSQDELRKMIPKKYSPARRVLFWVAAVGVTEVILSAFALVPGVGVLAHIDRAPGRQLAHLFGDIGFVVAALSMVASHVVRVGRSVREPGEGVGALSPKLQMALFIYRMFLMMFLATFASPGFLSRILVPVYVGVVGALFTYSDLYPQRFLSKLGMAGKRAPGARQGASAGKETSRPKPTR